MMFHEWTRINIIMKRARIFAAVSSGGLPPLIFHLKINIFVRFSSVLFSAWIAPEAKRVRKTGINIDNLSKMIQLWVGTIPLRSFLISSNRRPGFTNSMFPSRGSWFLSKNLSHQPWTKLERPWRFKGGNNVFNLKTSKIQESRTRTARTPTSRGALVQIFFLKTRRTRS